MVELALLAIAPNTYSLQLWVTESVGHAPVSRLPRGLCSAETEEVLPTRRPCLQHLLDDERADRGDGSVSGGRTGARGTMLVRGARPRALRDCGRTSQTPRRRRGTLAQRCAPVRVETRCVSPARPFRSRTHARRFQ